MTLLELSWFVVQVQPTQLTNPLMNRAGERSVYIGLVLLAIVITLILGILNRRLDIALIGALVLSSIMIALLFIA